MLFESNLDQMSIRRNTFYNLAGTLLPVVVGLLTVPAYLHLIGEERFGVLSIVWLLLGYFGFFDLGLSRATANFIAKMQDAEAYERQDVFWTAMGLNALFGLAGGIVMYEVAEPLIVHVFKMPDALRSEVLMVLPWMALAIPLATVSGVLVGTLEGSERFATVNAILVSGSVLIQVVPLLVAFFHGAGLEWLIPATIFARAATVPLLFVAVAGILPLGKNIRFERNLVKPLLGYGGWVATSFLIIPILETIDKFIIGSVLGARAVTYYTVPFNLVDRLRIIPRALMRSLFPVFSRSDRDEADSLAVRSMGTLAALLTPLTVIGIFMMGPFLTLWVGKDLSLHAAPLGEILLVGIWMNSLAHIPFALMEGRGRPDLLTKLQLFTLPFFLGMLWTGAIWYGLDGVAMAWSLRVWMDSNILLGIAKLLRSSWALIWPGALMVLMSWIVVKLYPNAVLLAAVLMLASIMWAWMIEPRFHQAICGCRNRLFKNRLLARGGK